LKPVDRHGPAPGTAARPPLRGPPWEAAVGYRSVDQSEHLELKGSVVRARGMRSVSTTTGVRVVRRPNRRARRGRLLVRRAGRACYHPPLRSGSRRP